LSSVFRAELRQLHELGYIESVPLDHIPPRGDELCGYVCITDAGRDFVRLRSGRS